MRSVSFLLRRSLSVTSSLSTTLRATVRDASGNPVDTPTTVMFELLSAPAGCNINGNIPLDSAVTHSGVATATLYAGSQTGGILLRAYTWRDSARLDTIATISSILAVVGGRPFAIDIDVDNRGTDAGGGAWIIEVSARVRDRQRNPVRNGIPVTFTVDPDIASIAPGHTGNRNREGFSSRGVAFSNLVYNSIDTFSPLTITASVETIDGRIENSREIVLPLQQGELTLHADPTHWMFEQGNEEAQITVQAMLFDGHQVPINNAPVLFTATRGRFAWFNFQRNQLVEYAPDPARKYTGVVDEENQEPEGTATVFLLAEEEDVFLDPFTLEVTVQVNAGVEGYADVFAQPVFIFFSRHAR